MTKKKKRGVSSSSSSKAPPPTATSSHVKSEIEDIFLTVLDECGALGRRSSSSSSDNNYENEDPWDQISLAVLDLANASDKLQLSSWINPQAQSEDHFGINKHPSQNNNQLILEVETSAQHVVTLCRSFPLKLQTQADHLFGLCQEVESMFQTVVKTGAGAGAGHKLQRARIVMRSVAGGIRQQTSLAQTVIDEILSSCLPHLYSIKDDDDIKSNTNTNVVAGQLRDCGHLLQRRCIEIECSPWMEALELLNNLHPSHRSKVDHPMEGPRYPEGAILRSQGPSDQLTESALPIWKKELSELSPTDGTTTEESSIQTPSILQAVNAFVRQDYDHFSSSNVTSLLLVGSEGSGKSSMCHQIKTLAKGRVQVIQPHFPLDLLGRSVGATEDILISLFAFAASHPEEERCLVLLDDVEHIFGQGYNGPNNNSSSSSDGRGGNSSLRTDKEAHLEARCRSMMLSILDTLERINTGYRNKVLLVCTATHNIGDVVGRFDEVHYLGPPNDAERKQMILSILESSKLFGQESWQSPEGGEMEDILSSVVESSVGLHYANLSLHCRQSILSHYEDVDQHHKIVQVLETLKQQIQTSTPSSLRSTLTSDFVDMNVLTAKDIARSFSALDDGSHQEGEGSPLNLPLFGSSAEAAWQVLRRLIVLPLCRAKALDRILYRHDGIGQKAGFSSGVLLTGPPGCGKSAIAYSVAAAAASMLPSIKLIDVSCTSLVHKEVGRSEQSVHKVFECARAAAPCILVMDAIENIAAVRGSDYTTEGTMDRVLSTLLTELDGVDNETTYAGGGGRGSTAIAIIGITSNVDWIDPALRRPGRLEKVVELTRPEKEARRLIAQKEIRQSPFLPVSSDPMYASTLDDLSQFVAEQTDGMTGAGVIALCNEAKLLCAQEESSSGATSTDRLARHLLCQRHFLECHGGAT